MCFFFYLTQIEYASGADAVYRAHCQARHQQSSEHHNSGVLVVWFRPRAVVRSKRWAKSSTHAKNSIGNSGSIIIIIGNLRAGPLLFFFWPALVERHVCFQVWCLRCDEDETKGSVELDQTKCIAVRSFQVKSTRKLKRGRLFYR